MEETGWKFDQEKHGHPKPIEVQLAPIICKASMFKLEKATKTQRSKKCGI